MQNRRAGMMNAVLEVEDGRLLVCSANGDQYFLMDSAGSTEKIDTQAAVRIYMANKGSDNKNVIQKPVDDLDNEFGWKERLQKRVGNKPGSFLNERMKEADSDE